MKSIFILSILLFTVHCDLSSVLSNLNANYTFSDYLNVDYSSVWWRSQNDLIEFAVLGRVDDGWVSVGFGGEAVLEGMVNVVAGSRGGVFQVVDGKLVEVAVSAVKVKDVVSVPDVYANFTLLTFAWDTKEKNDYFNLTVGKVGINMIFSLVDSLDVVNSSVSVVDLATGENATSFQPCNLFSNCRGPGGHCDDKFMCRCTEGWKGPRCTIPVPPPPPPPPTPNPPTNYEYSLEMPGLDGVTLRWNKTKDSVLISVEAVNHDGYVGFGINSYTGMVGADAVIGWIDQEGKGHINTYNLTSKRIAPEATPIPHLYNITDAKVYFYNGSTTITFERKRITGQHNITDDETIVLASIGNTPDPDILHHISHVTPCCPKVDFNTGKSEESFNYKLLHGILMVSAWGFLFPIGVLCARHLKAFGDIWFNLHSIIQPTGFIIALAAGGFIIYNTYITKSLHFQVGHPLGGLIVMILSLLQIIFALIRPHTPKSEKEKKTGVRVCWEYKHIWLGRILLLSSWVVILFGMCKYTGNELNLPKCITDPEYTPFFIAYFIWIGVLLLVIIALELFKCCNKQDSYKKIQ